MGATKFGKQPNAALRIADTNRFSFKGQFQNDKFYAPEMMKHPPDEKGDENDGKNKQPLSDEEEDLKRFQINVDFTDQAAALADTLVVPLNVTKIKYPILPPHPSSSSDDERTSHPHQKHPKKPTFSSHRNQFGSSPFPHLDRYITSLTHRSAPPVPSTLTPSKTPT